MASLFSKFSTQKIQNNYNVTSKRSALYNQQSEPNLYNTNLGQILKQNLQKIHDLHFNSPTYKRENPITHDGKQQFEEKNHHKTAVYKNVDHFYEKDPQPTNLSKGIPACNYLKNTSPQKQWKSSIKKIDFPLSQTYDQQEKLHLKKVELDEKYQRNPILDGISYDMQKKVRAVQTAGDQHISDQSKKLAQRKMAIYSERPSKDYSQFEYLHQSNINFLAGGNPYPTKNDNASKKKLDYNSQKSGQVMKELFSNQYLKIQKEVTGKIGSPSINNTTYSYNSVNQEDHRRIQNTLAKEEILAAKTSKPKEPQNKQEK